MVTNSTHPEPIQSTWKISDVISRYPDLVDVLARLNPTFRLLRNPVARRVQARLVTVAQAAQIARIEPDFLVSTLNEAVGLNVQEDTLATDETGTSRNIGAPPWVEKAPIAAEVDVRPLQLEGKEPFSMIMAAVRRVEKGEILRLHSSFEPVPLYDVLGQRGFEHFSLQLAEDEWEIRFFNSGRKLDRVVSTQTASPTDVALAWESPDATITIDVSELVPPEPLVRIMEALEELPNGASLLIHHVRRPIHLYPQLDQSGYRHETRELASGKVEILIQKPAAAE